MWYGRSYKESMRMKHKELLIFGKIACKYQVPLNQIKDFVRKWLFNKPKKGKEANGTI